MTTASVLIVSCHPSPTSRCTAIVSSICDHLDQKGTSFVHDDLYHAGFDPVLSLAELRDYHNGVVSDDIADLVAHLRGANELVFVFPLWMFDMPAMMKGYFEKIFRPDVAFRFSGNDIVPLLAQIKRLTVIVTHGRNEGETALSGDASQLFFDTSLPVLLPGLVSNKRFDLYSLDEPEGGAVEHTLAALLQRFSD